MKFRTEIQVKPATQHILHTDPVLTMGSCFAENISLLLKKSFFQILENPFGVLYNPLSIAQALRQIIENETFTTDDLIFHQGEWHSFWHHSTFSHHNQQQCLKNINEQISRAHQFLQRTRWLIVTFGTAYVYFLKRSNMVVANCHKLPEKEFTRRLISIEEIVSAWQNLLIRLQSFNPEIKIIFSVSPIRHLRDGLVQNQQSKATLILAVHKIIGQDQNLFYFPAYEILLDDLRDYRFYEANLTHPNQQAIDYIWEKFQSMFFNSNTKKTVRELLNFQKRLEHKVQNPDSPTARAFKEQTANQWRQLLKKYPYLQSHQIFPD